MNIKNFKFQKFTFISLILLFSSFGIFGIIDKVLAADCDTSLAVCGDSTNFVNPKLVCSLMPGLFGGSCGVHPECFCLPNSAEKYEITCIDVGGTCNCLSVDKTEDCYDQCCQDWKGGNFDCSSGSCAAATTTTTTTIPSGPGVCVYNANPPTYVYAGTCYDSSSESCTGACPAGYERDSQPCSWPQVDCTGCDPGDDRCCDCKCDFNADGTCPAGCPGDPDCSATTTTTTAPGPTTTTAPGPTTTTAPGPTTTTAPSGPVWPVTFSNPINATTFEELIVSIINWLLAIIGSIVLLFIIIGGIMYMTAAGNEEQIKRAKRILFYTILGFAVVLISYSLIQEIKKILGM